MGEVQAGRTHAGGGDGAHGGGGVGRQRAVESEGGSGEDAMKVGLARRQESVMVLLFLLFLFHMLMIGKR